MKLPVPRSLRARCSVALCSSLALLVTLSIRASAQEARWTQMSQQVEQLREQGRSAQAISLAQQTVQVAAATYGPQDRRVGLSLDALGVLLTDRDDFGGAETSLRRALDILRKSAGPESKEAGQTLLHLARLYSSHGRWGEAEGAFRDALTANVKTYGQNDPHVADVLFYGSSLLIDEGKLYDAARVIRGAIAIYTNAGPAYNLQLVASYNTAGEVVEDSGDHKVAETLYQRAIDIGEKAFGPNNSDLAVSLMGLGSVYKSEERYADAAPLFERSLAILAHNVAPTNPDLVEAEVNIALFYYAWDKPERAGPWFDKYLGNRIAQMRANAATMSEKDRLVTYATLPGTFPIYFSFATRYHDRDPALAGKVYDALLEERGFVAESAASIRARILASGDTQALALLDKIAVEKTQLAALSQSNTDDAAHRTQISQLAQETNQMEQELARRSASLSEANTLAVATWRDVQKALKPGEAAVEITRFQFHTGKTFVANRIYIALVVTPQSRFPQLIVLGDSKDLEAAPLTNFRLVVAKTRGVTAEPEPGAPAASEAATVDTSEAYNGFWKPLEPALTGIKRVYVASDGVLSQLPIGLLSDSTGKLLIEKYQLRCVNSTRDILRPQHSATVRSAVLVGNPKFELTPTAQRAASAPGQSPSSSPATQPSVNLSGGPLNPLPGTEVEVNAIEKLLRQSGWQTTLYTEDRALKTSIQRVRSPRVVHIATHGFFLEDQRPPDKSGRDVRLSQVSDDPMLRSGLFFAGANRTRAGVVPAPGQDDGVLTAYEASQLNLQGTELVVLSACETGLGEQSNGEGVFGLRRALQEAGAESVMMSMWSVPDQETQELMSLFYAKWLGGLDKPDALRQAQLEEREVVRKRYGKDLPYYWGAFVLVSR
jgi:CHAT domain-containing protein